MHVIMQRKNIICSGGNHSFKLGLKKVNIVQCLSVFTAQKVPIYEYFGLYGKEGAVHFSIILLKHTFTEQFIPVQYTKYM